ncbi:hypothetical protein N7493_001289 [Penicillium malachiteum]|uniref:Transcription factor domain-containing protein n=1 Tax=Penicillium malachiteum TaxID=1324776 RepID=A0AAD6HTX0_9EURO|nr:hypothetical protein N7493_001289 [Penicillium malachiteum]
MTAPNENTRGDAQRRANWEPSIKLYWIARRATLITAAIEPESLEALVAEFLTFQYLMYIHDRRISEAWNILGMTVRMAQGIGCHRDVPYKQSYGEGYGATFSTQTTKPSNFEFCAHYKSLPKPRPLTEPTSATFLILRCRLARLTGRIADHFQRLDRAGTYAEVSQLDQELLEFAQSLPSHFGVENTNESLDGVIKGLSLSRYMLGTEIMMIRIMLHATPVVLVPIVERRVSPVAASVPLTQEIAHLDHLQRKKFRQHRAQQHDSIFTGTFREFNAAVIAGIAAIIFPHGQDAHTMRLIMRTFLERHPVNQRKTESKASQKEIAIIYTLYRRAMHVLKNLQWRTPGDGDPIDHLLGVDSPAAECGANDPRDRGQSQISQGRYPDDVEENDDLLERSDYGEERSTAILVRDIFAAMVKHKILPGGQTAAPTAAPSPQPEPVQQPLLYNEVSGNSMYGMETPDSHGSCHPSWTQNSSATPTISSPSFQVSSLQPQSTMFMNRAPMVSTNEHHLPEFDLQAVFDVWLSANASVNPYPPSSSNLPLTNLAYEQLGEFGDVWNSTSLHDSSTLDGIGNTTIRSANEAHGNLGYDLWQGMTGE